MTARRQIVTGAALLIAAWLAAPAVRAESVFAREGLGEWLEGYDVRGETLGSTGLGVIDPNNFCTINPATTAFSQNTLAHFGLGSGVRWTTDDVNTTHRAATYLTGTGLYLALPSHLGVRLAMTPASDPTYRLETTVVTGWEGREEDVRREEGSRGLLRYEAGLSWRGGANWALGGGIGLTAGTLRDKTLYAFGDSAEDHGYADGSDLRRLLVKPAVSFSAGALLRALPRLSLGGFLTTAASGDIEETYQGFGATETTVDTARVDLPFGLGGGAAVQLTNDLRLSADLVWRRWEEAGFAGVSDARLAPRFRNTLRWGVGLERVPVVEKTTPLLRSISWRAGFAMIPWYLRDRDGDGIDEWRLSAGAGIPIRQNRGSIDLMLAYGRRGSLAANGLEETYFRFGLAGTFARVLREY